MKGIHHNGAMKEKPDKGKKIPLDNKNMALKPNPMKGRSYNPMKGTWQ